MSSQSYTHEQLEAAKAVKTPEELIAMAKEQGIEITPEQATDFLKTLETYPLLDEELDNVAGGGCGYNPAYWEMAYEDGRRILFDSFGGIILLGPCGCGLDTMKEATFARKMDHNTGPLENWIYWDCKCYACGKTLDYIYVSRTN